ncbi:uncharacterized protein LOC110734424 [Chenopodium quinoa]|uniref:Sec-independent protein translocase protein TatB n=1 Tax=Chenopodium quinoa TaxID=63459 RepID=A0A803LFJ3_CHEQI|nr:uncharacterized protein LOC110734424 [Chenopodium quinoa]XP_021770268.1 uncharacterized protein LOC110734424 [Chenopodium quinoa]XP_021770269.1 uncharacterized protein LOC110734424 [Chenopodium quinoa]XP_021770270.1 uncharacterized protein LOC110734424 [Chenopodium quinoa]
MLGLSYGEIFVILGATAALIGPKDLPLIARTAGRLAGRAIGYVQLARGQFENVMQQTQFRQVNKELQDTMAQLEAIRYEISSISVMNPGPLTRRLMDNPDQDNMNTGATANTGPLNISDESTAPREHLVQPQQIQQQLHSFKTETSVFKEHGSVASGTSNLYSQATAYAKLAETPAVKSGTIEGSVSMDTVDDRPGLLSVLPVSAESAGLLPNRQGEVTGSDIVLEAMLEAEVARNAKEFFSQPQNEIKFE